LVYCSHSKVKRDQLFPRFHQLDVVRKLLADAKAKGAGRDYGPDLAA
jgi:hypothetical protein